MQSLSASLASGVLIFEVFLDRATGTNHDDRSSRRRIGMVVKMRVDVARGRSSVRDRCRARELGQCWSCLPIAWYLGSTASSEARV